MRPAIEASYDEWWHGGPAGERPLVEDTNAAQRESLAWVDNLVAYEADPSALTLGDTIVKVCH